jgi:hypothetical protein
MLQHMKTSPDFSSVSIESALLEQKILLGFLKM